MSPSRRDILKAAGALAAALAIPQPVRAVEPIVAAPKIRLSMAAIALVNGDESMRQIVIAEGRRGTDLGRVHFNAPPVDGRYGESTIVELTEDEFATVADILTTAGLRALELVAKRTGAPS